MFRPESYITPIILRLLEKYVKNLKVQDTQVSLWSGEAVFSNLDLRTEAMEELLGLPFSFVNGHIHELRISVPWHKITYEPIVITINTMECVLSLAEYAATAVASAQNGADDLSDAHCSSNDSYASGDASASARRASRPASSPAVDAELPSGYLQSLVRKITDNITLVCNNLILKYAEDDLVLSVNVRNVNYCAADADWAPAFCDDPLPPLLFRRRLVQLSDLTVCLDHRNRAGKIEVFQEPVLFRCSLRLRWLLQYSGVTASVADMSWMAVMCERLNFSVSDRQLPMVWRLTQLALALTTGSLQSTQSGGNQHYPSPTAADDDVTQQGDEADQSDASWAEWAWSLVPSTDALFAVGDEDPSREGRLARHERVFRLSVHVKSLDVTFKCSSRNAGQSQRSLKCQPFLQVVCDGCFTELTRCGVRSTVVRAAASRVTVNPVGNCTCSVSGVVCASHGDDATGSYCSWGTETDDSFASDSLFSQQQPGDLRRAFEITHQTHQQRFSDDHQLSTGGAAITFDYVYTLQLPDDFSDEHLPQLTSVLSEGLPEMSSMRLLFGSASVTVDCGLVHRLQFIGGHAASKKYRPYSELAEPTNLLPATGVNFREHLSSSCHVVIGWRCPTLLVCGSLSKHASAVESKARVSVRVRCDSIQYVKLCPMRALEVVSVVAKARCSSEDIVNKCRVRHCCTVSSVQFHLVTAGFQRNIGSIESVTLSHNILCLPQLWPRTDLSCTESVFQLNKFRLDLLMENFVHLMGIVSLRSDLNAALLRDKRKILVDVEEMTYQSHYNVNIGVIVCKTQDILVCVQNSELCSPHIIFSHAKNNNQHSSSRIQFLVSFPMKFDTRIKSTICVVLESSPHMVCLDPLLFTLLSLINSIELSDRQSPLKMSVEPVFDYVERQSTDSQREQAVGNSRNDHRADDKTVSDNLPQPHLSRSCRSRSSQELDRCTSVRSTSTTSGLTKTRDRPSSKVVYSRWLKNTVLLIELGAVSIRLPASAFLCGPRGLEEEYVRQSRDGSVNCEVVDVEELTLILPAVSVGGCKSRAGQHNEFLCHPTKLLAEQPKCNMPWSVKLSGASLRCAAHDKTCVALLESQVAECTVGVDGTDACTAIVLHANVPIVNISFGYDHACLLIKAYSLFTETLAPFSRRGSATDRFTSEYPTPVGAYRSRALGSSIKEASVKTNDGKSQCDYVVTERKASFWLQLTLPRVCVAFLTEDVPVFRAVIEDTALALDVQSLYTKTKLNVGSVDVVRVTSDSMNSTDLVNNVFTSCLRVKRDLKIKTLRPTELGDDSATAALIDVSANIAPPVQPDSNCWLSLNFTRASREDVLRRWNQHSLAECGSKEVEMIAELEIQLKPTDLVVSSDFLTSCRPLVSTVELFTRKSVCSKKSTLAPISCATLPLVYADIGVLRLFLPVLDHKYLANDNMLVFQVTGITVGLSTEFPLTRPVLMPDLFTQAQRDGSIQIPGAKVEDRQYQVNISDAFIASGKWCELVAISADSRPSVLSGYTTMGDNPAVEWNHFDPDRVATMRALVPLLDKCCCRVTLAPAITTCMKNCPAGLVAGSGAEISVTSDLDLALDIYQIGLIYHLYKSTMTAVETMFSATSSADVLKCGEVMVNESIVGCDRNTVQSAKASVISSSKIGLVSLDSGFASNICPLPVSSDTSHDDEEKECTVVPSEVLITFGNVSFSVYNSLHDGSTYLFGESAQGNDTGARSPVRRITPLMYLYFSQPHLYWHITSKAQKFQMSIFDCSLLIHRMSEHSADDCCYLVPDLTCYRVRLLQTEPGNIHPKTGIPLSFFMMSVDNMSSENRCVDVNLGRPIKLSCPDGCNDQICKTVEQIQLQMKESFLLLSTESASGFVTDSSLVGNTKSSILSNICDFCRVNRSFKIQCCQLFIEGALCSYYLNFCVGSVNASTFASVSKTGNVSNLSIKLDVENMFLCSVSADKCTEVPLVGPTSLCVKSTMIWEQWSVSPYISLYFKSDYLPVDIGVGQLTVLEGLLHYIKESNGKCENPADVTADQHPEYASHDISYFDDLRNGSMVYIEAHQSSQCPVNHIMFDQHSGSMTWRYPETRILNDVKVLPVPFIEGSELNQQNIDASEYARKLLRCDLQYFDHLLNHFSTICHFFLSEEQDNHVQLPLPTELHRTPLSDMWRIRVNLPDSDKGTTGVDSVCLRVSALAACVVINSRVHPAALPQLTVALELGCCEIRCHVNGSRLPIATLSQGDVHSSDSNATLADVVSVKAVVDGASMFYYAWPASNRCLLEAAISLNTLNPAFHMDVPVVEKSRFRLDVFFDDSRLDNSGSRQKLPQVDITLVTSHIEVKLSQTALLQLNAALENCQCCLSGRDNDHSPLPPVVRYCVVNNTGCPFTIGQHATPQNIILHSHALCLYTWWKVDYGRLLRVEVASSCDVHREHNERAYASFSIDTEGSYVSKVLCADTHFPLLVFVESTSGGVHQLVRLEGRLHVLNLTDLALRAHIDASPFSQLFDVGPNSRSPSVLCNQAQISVALDNVSNESGTGSRPMFIDVDLENDSACLIQLSSGVHVWCQVMSDKVIIDGHARRQTVVVSPVFSAVSLLATPLRVFNTPGDGHCVLSGSGAVSTLIFDPAITHYLTLEVDPQCGTSCPPLPLSSSMLEQCDKAATVCDLDSLSVSVFARKSWLPSELTVFEKLLKPAEQSDIKLHVAFERRWPWLNTLLVKIYPTTLVVNLTSQLLVFRTGSLNAHQNFLPPFSIVASPYEDGTFFVGALLGDSEYQSSGLSLGRHGWLSERTLPAFQGVVPANGSARFFVFADRTVGVFCLRSLCHDGVQWLIIQPAVLVVNRTGQPLPMASVACSWSDHTRPLPVAAATELPICVEHSRDITVEAQQALWWHLADGITPEPTTNNREHKLLLDFSGCSERALELESEPDSVSIAGPHCCPCLIVSFSTNNEQCCVIVETDSSPYLLLKNESDIDLKVDYAGTSETHRYRFVNSGHPHLVRAKSERFFSEPASAAMTDGENMMPYLNLRQFSDDDDSSLASGVDLDFRHAQYIRVGGVHLTATVTVNGATFVVRVEPVIGVLVSATHIRHRLEEAVACDTATTHSMPQPSMTCDGDDDITDTEPLKTGAHMSTDSELEPCRLNEVESATREVRVTLACGSVSIVMCDDLLGSPDHLQEVLRLSVDQIVFTVHPSTSSINTHAYDVCLCALLVQLDNQLLSDTGSCNRRFDVLLASNESSSSSLLSRSPLECQSAVELGALVNAVRRSAVVSLWLSVNPSTILMVNDGAVGWRIRQLRLCMRPLTVFYDDTDAAAILRYLESLSEALTRSAVIPDVKKLHLLDSERRGDISNTYRITTGSVESVSALGRRIILDDLHIEALQLTVHVQTQLKLQLRVSGAPLAFPALRRRAVRASRQRVVAALIKFYVWSALYRAGAVVGSLDVLADAGGLTRSVSAGVSDLFRLPCAGFMSSGATGLAAGCVSGAVSLAGHVTAGTVCSLAALAEAVARNLDAVSCDSDHWRRSEQRRHTIGSSGLATAVSHGLTELGINLLSAVAGLAQQPLQGAVDAGTAGAVVQGFGRGVLGAVVKPLSAAADLVAHTGRGLLHSTGWRSTPKPRSGFPARMPYYQFSPASVWFSVRFCSTEECVSVRPAAMSTVTDGAMLLREAWVMLTSRRLCVVSTEDKMPALLHTHSLAEVNLVESPEDPDVVQMFLVDSLYPSADLRDTSGGGDSPIGGRLAGCDNTGQYDYVVEYLRRVSVHPPETCSTIDDSCQRLARTAPVVWSVVMSASDRAAILSLFRLTKQRR